MNDKSTAMMMRCVTVLALLAIFCVLVGVSDMLRQIADRLPVAVEVRTSG